MSENSYNLERLKFLIVDDNKHMRKLVKSVLYALGVSDLVEAEDGTSAIEQLKSHSADLIICDWNMAPMDGLEFVKKVRAGGDSLDPHVPIILVTGYTEMARVVEARDSGVHEILAKPISAQSLYSRVKTIIENPRTFVDTETYIGPDRRRQQIGLDFDDRRGPVPPVESAAIPAHETPAPPA